jgi:hypothetical protein
VRRGDGAALAPSGAFVNPIERAELDLGLCLDNTLVIAAVNVVFPWSM